MIGLGVPEVDGLRADRLVLPGDRPYIDRYHIAYGPDFAARYHHWRASDDQRARHDHPAANLTLVLAGELLEHGEQGDRLLTAGTLVTREATEAHAVELLSDDAWTLFVLGKVCRRWGFWTDRGWVLWTEYEHAGRYLIDG